MFVNPNVYPAIGLGAILFYCGAVLSQRIASVAARRWLGIAFFILCLPGLAMLAYYTHLLGEPPWFLTLRSLPGIEIAAAGWGLFFGFLTTYAPRPDTRRRRVANRYWYILAFLCIFVPFSKPILKPVALAEPLRNEWQQGICLQSSEATCGPASLATIFSAFGMPRTEADIARASFSCRSGTEIWYLMRYARRNGLQVACLHERRLAQIPTPAILGVRISGFGHFIVLLGKEKDQYILGDPLFGRQLLSERQFADLYSFSGAVFAFSRK